MSNAIKQSSVVAEAEEGTKADESKGGKSMEDLENIKVLDSNPCPSFYEDDNGKKFFIAEGWRNDSLVESLEVNLVDEGDYADLGEEIGATKTGQWGDYERPELLKRLRELGRQAVAITIYNLDLYDEIDQCDDNDMNYEDNAHDGILFAGKNVDLENYIKLYNMNQSKSFVRILTSDWKISKVIPWIIKDCCVDDNNDLSPYAIEELHRLGIKIQKVYKELEWDEQK